MDDKIVKDMEIVTNGGEMSADLERLVNRVHRYMGKTKVTDEREFVDIIILMSAILDVPEETFLKMINRLNHIMVEVHTGMSPEQLVNMAMMQKGPKGPIN